MNDTTNGEAMPAKPARTARESYEVWYEDQGVQLLGMFADEDAAVDVARTMSRAWGTDMRVRRLPTRQ